MGYIVSQPSTDTIHVELRWESAVIYSDFGDKRIEVSPEQVFQLVRLLVEDEKVKEWLQERITTLEGAR